MADSWPTMERRGPAVDEQSVEQFERELGTGLPESYRRFLLEVNGGRPADTACTPPGRSPINSLYSLDDPDEGRQLRPAPQYGGALPSRDLIAIGFEDGGCKILLCVAGERKGQVWYLDGGDLRRPDDANPRVDWSNRRDMEKVADEFGEFVAQLGPLRSRPSGS